MAELDHYVGKFPKDGPVVIITATYNGLFGSFVNSVADADTTYT
jgi:hypothetical protein